MSSTNRGATRSPADYYATPQWCVRRLIEAVDLPGGEWLEPAAGDGAIIRGIARDDVCWTAWELRAEERQALQGVVPKNRVNIGDFLAASAAGTIVDTHFSVAITNPPFSLAQQFIDTSLEHADHVVMLLRLNYLASQARHAFMSTHTPDVYVLPNRPSFTGGKTDSIEYAWFVWRRRRRTEGKVRVLALK